MKKTIALTMVVFFLLTGIGVCGMFDHQGIEISAGGFSHVAPGADDANYDFDWFSVSLFNRHDIDDNWNVVIEGSLGYLKWSGKDNNPDADSFHLGAQLILYRTIYKNLSLGLGGGLGTLSNTSDLPDLGDSGLYGTITGRLKLAVSEKYGFEFGADHISDALQNGSDKGDDGKGGDCGKNVLALKFYYMFN